MQSNPVSRNDYDSIANEIIRVEQVLLTSARRHFSEDSDSLYITKNGFLEATLSLHTYSQYVRNLAEVHHKHTESKREVRVYVVTAWDNGKQKECIVLSDFPSASNLRDKFQDTYGAANVCLASRVVQG